MTQKSPRDVDLRVAGGDVASRAMNLFQEVGRVSNSRARASIGISNERGHGPGSDERADKFLRKSAPGVEVSSVPISHDSAQFRYDLLELLAVISISVP